MSTACRFLPTCPSYLLTSPALIVTTSVEMVRSSYSDKNTKDEERRESLSAKDKPLYYVRRRAPSPQTTF